MTRSQAPWEEPRNIPSDTRLLPPVISTTSWAMWHLSHRRKKTNHLQQLRQENRSRCPSRSQSHRAYRPTAATLLRKKTAQTRRLRRRRNRKHCRSHRGNRPTTIIALTFGSLRVSRRQISSWKLSIVQIRVYYRDPANLLGIALYGKPIA